MNKHPSYETRNIRRIFGLLVTVLFCGQLLKPVPAFAYITPSIRAIVIQAVPRPSLKTDSEPQRNMAKLLQTSPQLSPDNIKDLAVSYLSSRLGDKVAVSQWGHGDIAEQPHGSMTIVLRIDYSVWPQEVDGKSLLVGVVAVHRATFRKDGLCFDPSAVAGTPVDSFVVSDDAIETQHNLKDAIARVLSWFATVHQVPDNE